MKQLLMFLSFMILFPALSFAGFNICDNAGVLSRIGSSPIPGCLYFSDEDLTEYNRVNTLWESTRHDFLEIVGGVVVEKSLAAQTAILDAEAQAVIDAENARVEAIDTNLNASQSIRLTNVENRIDNIGNLADAKVFLKKLVRYIARSSSSI